MTTQEGRRFETRNDLDRDPRIEMIGMLNRTLADATDLMTPLKRAHWHVKGREFQQLHEPLGQQATLLQAHVDLLAERPTVLCGSARRTVHMAAGESRIQEYPEDVVVDVDVVDALADCFARRAAELRADVDAAMDAGDENAADRYVEFSREIDEQLWSLEAHLQDDSLVEETDVTVAAGD